MKEVDPISLQVIGGALHSIAEQMGNVLYRMSYSSIIRESQDLGAGLFDRDYNTLCESDSTPMHIGSLPGYLRGIEKSVPLDAWKPGDCVIHNHPYFGASHSPDIAIVMPVFFEGELVGFSANTAHHVDIGAATPGLVIDIPDVFAEGMLLNGLKLFNEGKRNESLWKFIRDNTRVPSLVMGDLEAQIASAELGVQRFSPADADLRQGHRAPGDAAADGLYRGDAAPRDRQDPGRRLCRRGLPRRRRPQPRRHLPLKVTVRVRGDGVEVDTTGSSPQVPTAFNVPFDGSTKVACYFAFRALLLDTYTHEEYIPQNEGSFRPVKVTSPLGSIFNPISPAAAEARFSQIQRVVDLIIKALAPVLPTSARPATRRCCPSPPIRAFAPAATTGCSSKSTRRRWAAGLSPTARHGRGTDAQHAQQSARGSRHAPAADLRPLRGARRRAAGRRQVPRRRRRGQVAALPDAGLHDA
jgi:N-methylhydantoinase B